MTTRVQPMNVEKAEGARRAGPPQPYFRQWSSKALESSMCANCLRAIETHLQLQLRRVQQTADEVE